MWKLRWYIAKSVFFSILLVTLVLISIDTIFTLVTQIGQVGSGFTVADAVEFTLMRLPSDLYLMIPVTAFLGALIGLGHLASKSELVAMRAAGVSVLQIASGVAWAAIFFVVVTYALGLYVSPVTRHWAYFKKNSAGHSQAVLVLASATWLKSGDHFIFIGKTLPDGHLADLMDFDVVDNELKNVTSAQYATVRRSNWSLENAKVLDVNTQQITSHTYKEIPRTIKVSPNLIRILTLEPADMTVPALWAYIHYRVKNQLDPRPYQLQLWERVFQPITVLILMLLAVPFVFGPLRSSSAGVRVIIGVVVGFAFYILSQFFGSFSLLYHVIPFWGAAFPSLLFLLVLILLVRRIN